MKCNECGKEIEIGNREDGLPNGVGFMLEDGTTVNYCTDCLILLGEKMETSENND